MAQELFDVKGLKRLNKNIDLLEKKVAKKVIKKAVRETGKATILKAARANAKSILGGDLGKLISKATKLQPNKKQRKGQYAMMVKPSDKFNDELTHTSKAGRVTYIPYAIEYGHGNAKPIPIFRKAYLSMKDKAEKLMIAETLKGIDQAVRELKA